MGRQTHANSRAEIAKQLGRVLCLQEVGPERGGRRISVATQSIGLVAPESTPVERKALALLLRQRETSLAETGINRVSFDRHGLSNGYKAPRSSFAELQLQAVSF